MPEGSVTAGGAGRRVLIVEDDDATRDLMIRLVRGAGCDVRAAATVAEALALLRAEVPTHILLDLMLPDDNGVVLLRAVRRQKLHVRVALVTAAGRGSEIVASAMLEHPDAVFHKPVDVPQIEAWLAAPIPPQPPADSKRLLVEVDLAVLAAHLAEEQGQSVEMPEVRQWLQDAGFTPHETGWIVPEPELGQLDPSEVIWVQDV